MVVEIPVPNGFVKVLGLDRPNSISVNSCDIRVRESSSAKGQDIKQTKDNRTNISDRTTTTAVTTTTSGSQVPKLPTANRAAIKRYYIDELGFYRYLDYEQKQYVCSNVSMINRGSKKTNTTIQNQRQVTTNDNNNKEISSAAAAPSLEVGLEVCFKTVRHDLGISHFDKTEDYDNWKRSWDEFMRVKLISQQPVTLNSELKNRVRSGIPHDYRAKVWTALIRMRTRTIRATFGEDIYDVILSDYVSKIGIPDYSQTSEEQKVQQQVSESRKSSHQDSNNNMAPGGGGGAPAVATSSTLAKTKHQNNSNNLHDNAAGSSYISPMSAHNKNNNNSGQVTAQHLSQRVLAQEPSIDKCFKQIELDLLRTLPNNRHFENPNSIGIKRVRRVLRAYACFNQEVAYCQGMNRLAAMALLVLPEEEAFWCLVAIIQCIMPRDYYLKPWLAQVDCCVLGDLLEKKLPKLHKHLIKNDIQLTLFSWFFTIFVDGFRPELMLRIWDCFLLEGDKVLFRFALAILYITQDELLKMSDFSTMSSHLSRLVSTRALDVEHLFQAFNMMNPLSTGSLQARREFHRRRMRAMLEE